MFKKVFYIILLVLIIAFLFPIKIICKVPDQTCNTITHENGSIEKIYDLEPLGIALLEKLFQKNIPLTYKEDYQITKAQ